MPFLVQWKGQLPAGKVYKRPVIQLDLHTTVLAVAGVAVKPDWKLDGVNLPSFLEGKAAGVPHQALYWRFDEQRAIRKGDWKLVRPDLATDRPFGNVAKKSLLFNLADDIGETKDLAEARAELVKEQEADWQKWNRSLASPAWIHHSFQKPRKRQQHRPASLQENAITTIGPAQHLFPKHAVLHRRGKHDGCSHREARSATGCRLL